MTKVKALVKRKLSASKSKNSKEKPALHIPPILLEGDQPQSIPPSGPGQRYALGPTPPDEQFAEEGELPEAYGTKRLLLAARDPHWLYAHWDLTRQQLRDYNAASADGHLVLRVFVNAIGDLIASEVHVHPESRHWFIHVEHGATKYLAQLGYYKRDGKWVAISESAPTLTPSESISNETAVEFATIPVDVPFKRLLEFVKALVAEHVPLAEAIEQLRATGHPDLPSAAAFSSGTFSDTQEKALAAVISMDQLRRVWIGSLEVTELVRRKMVEELASIAAAQVGQLASQMGIGMGASVSSPFGAQERQRGFWFNVNAELIIYGATEPDAKVTIGGRTIQLRPDGSFSYRFALPDGKYPLPAVAVSADGEDTRWANLQFTRKTQYGGDVGAHPQDKKLKLPVAESVA